MNDVIIPATYERTASFREWAHRTTMERPTMRARLRAEREALLEEINWSCWKSEQSRRLVLLDYLLEI